MSDPLSDVLDLIGVQSSVYFQKDFRAPWGMRVENTGFAQFHIIVSGEAVVAFQGDNSHLSSGDVVLFPAGGGHVIGDTPDAIAIPGHDVITAIAGGEDVFASGGRRTRMICGHFDYDLDHKHPVIQELPSMLVLRAAEIPDIDVLLTLLRLLIRETLVTSIGGAVIVRHLSTALLVAILRTYFQISDRQTGFYAGLMDERIARSLLAIHREPLEKLSLVFLAQAAGMSRSAFAERFRTVVGQTPGEYAICWKLLKAAQSLRHFDRSVEQIAIETGYQSSTAFSRSFQRLFGDTPSNYRRKSL